MIKLNIENFIKKYVIKREVSMFSHDCEANIDDLYNKITGKTALVIGGAGSIGSAYIKTIIKYEPAALVVVDTNENGLTELTRDLRSSGDTRVPKIYLTYPMDYSSEVFRRMFLSRKGFDIVANFSAHKHVRSEKDIYSVEALLENNVIHAEKLLELLSIYPPEEYFCVSTDKAANPVNIMGASKRIMEDLIFSYSDTFPVKTARFANVAFSNGSLPDGFLKRIEKRQPLSAPSDVKRYFVSPDESGQICTLACMLGNNREIFFPKLEQAQMMRFDTIARNLLKEYGYEALECSSDSEALYKMTKTDELGNKYPVHFSLSDTSGEKSYEEFYTEDESVDLQRFSSLGVIIDKEIPDKNRVRQVISDMEGAFSRADVSKEDIVNIIKAYLPNFSHIETNKSLDEKM